MRYHFIILALIAVVYIQSQTVLLTPVLPASAFENEFYQVRFRVRNLVGARFEFKNVPSFFTASSDGLISGVPTKQGLYAIEVVYFNDSFKDSKQVIIQVRRGTKLTNYNTQSETQQSSPQTPQLKPKQQYLYTYNQNDQLNIQVNVTNGNAPYRFQPIYIPPEMQFNNKTGTIAGAFRKYGDYLIGIKVKDAKENQVQVLMKISIVVRNTTSPKFIFYQRSLIQVAFMVKSVNGATNAIGSNASQIKTDTVANNKNTGGSVNLPTTPTTTQTKPDPVKPSTPSTQTTSSTSPSSTPTPTLSTPPVIPQSAANSASKSQQIISTQDLIKKNITNTADLQQIQKKKTTLTQQLTDSKQQLKTCYSNVQQARKSVQTLHNNYNEQFNKVDQLKDQLQQLKSRSLKASADLEQKLGKLKILEIQRRLQQKQYNRSLLSYDNVKFAYNGSMVNIQKNQQQIKSLQESIQTKKRQLDANYKILDQAMVYSSKLETQRNHINQEIKKGMGVFSKINLTKQNFGGCDNLKFYPKSVGVGQVRKVLDKIYLLTNNQFVTFGDCTEHQRALPGDIIEWKGYLMNGLVSALVVKRLK